MHAMLDIFKVDQRSFEAYFKVKVISLNDMPEQSSNLFFTTLL